MPDRRQEVRRSDRSQASDPSGSTPAPGDARGDAAALLLRIERRTAGLGGGDYLEALADALREAVGASVAFVGRVVGEPPSRAEALWVSAGDGRAAPFCYELAGTPCEKVAAGSPCVHPWDVRRRFPEDEILADLEAESYAGAPLRDRKGQTIGLLALVSSAPLDAPATVEDLLTLLGRRAALELERVETHDRLRESERRLRSLTDHLPGVPFQVVYDESFTPIFIAGRIEELTGWPREAFFSGEITIPRLFHPEDRSWIVAAIDSAIDRGRPIHLVHRMVTRDGRIRWVEVRCAARRDEADGLLLLEGIALDVSERKRAEEEIRENYVRYRTMFEDNWAAKVLVDPSRMSIADLNGAAARLFACDRDEIVGHPLSRYLRGENLDLDRLFHRRAARGLPVGDAELVDLKGRPHVVQLFTGPLRVSGRDYLYLILHDVTELRQAEEERKRLEEKVQQAERIESLGMLAGGVAHDFNNLLVGILANAEIARDLAADRRDLVAPLSDIEQSATRAAELVAQLLAYAGRAELEKKPVRLNELVEDTLRLLQAQLRPFQPIEVDARQEVVVVGDATRLRQVVLNLLTNAAEATKPAPGALGVRIRSLETKGVLVLPDDARLPAGRYAVLEVWDRGPGIPKELHRRIFEPFFTTKFDGRGLGLAAVAGIVRGHGGAIEVVSGPDEGAVFRVYLPVASAAAAPARSPSRQEVGVPSQGASLRVLVVDDEAVVRRTARLCLEHAGYQVEEADSCRAAVELLGDDPDRFDCLLLDVVMPDAEASDVLEHLRARGLDLPVVLMSGYGAEDVVKRRQAGLTVRFLPKPFRSRDLLAAVGESLCERRDGGSAPAEGGSGRGSDEGRIETRSLRFVRPAAGARTQRATADQETGDESYRGGQEERRPLGGGDVEQHGRTSGD